MHVPLAPPLSPSAPTAPHYPSDDVYTASLQELDGLIGELKTASDEDNTLIWFTGSSAVPLFLL